MGKLTAVSVRALTAPGRYGDGDGLYVDVAPGGARTWIVRVQSSGKRRDIGLGSLKLIGLADARTAAADIRRKVRAGGDPVAERREAKRKVEVPTFRVAAKTCHAEYLPTWKNEKHAWQWLATLEAHAFPLLGDRTVDRIEASAVRDVLAPIWLTTPETARRVRQRIGAVLDWAHGKGFREAPLIVKALSASLPRQAKATRHYEAMPWQDVPAFIKTMHASSKGSGAVKLALEFLILTAARSGEVRGALWSEIDRDGKLWRIPADRMKAKRSHNVPLSDRALAIIDRVAELREDDAALIWPGQSGKKPMSDMTLKMALRRLGLSADPHGFRSSFRDWVSEATAYREAVAEAALAHAKGDKTEAAYARSDLLEKRRAMMADWAATVGNV